VAPFPARAPRCPAGPALPPFLLWLCLADRLAGAARQAGPAPEARRAASPPSSGRRRSTQLSPPPLLFPPAGLLPTATAASCTKRRVPQCRAARRLVDPRSTPRYPPHRHGRPSKLLELKNPRRN
jgi:hypothetical protein